MTQGSGETPNQHKLRSIRVTAAARFSAAHRLRRHESVSLFSISICSLAVVVISMLEPFGVKLSVPPNAVNLCLAAISLLTLVVSLLVSGNKYGERAEKMHAGAVEINAIGRRLESAIADSDNELVSELSEQYENALKIHENHKDIDYTAATIKRYPAHYKIGRIDKLLCWARLKLDVAPHLAPLFLLAVFLFYLLRDACIECATP